jgi:hypothetical protein
MKREATRAVKKAYLSTPHSAHPGTNIKAHVLACSACLSAACNRWPTCSIEQAEQAIRNEAGPCGIDVPITLRVLPVGKKPLGYDEYRLSLTRVMATYRSRRSSSISADVPVQRSDGRQPSITLSTNADFHSWPWRNGSSKGSDSLRRATVLQPDRWWHPVDQALAR